MLVGPKSPVLPFFLGMHPLHGVISLFSVNLIMCTGGARRSCLESIPNCFGKIEISVLSSSRLRR